MGFLRKKKEPKRVKKDPDRSDTQSFSPSPLSTPLSSASVLSADSEGLQLTPEGYLPPPRDNRLFRAPQGPVGQGVQKTNRTCPKCYGPCMRLITRFSPRNTNSGRPYIKCCDSKCDKWVCWDDNRGTYDGNPRCRCGVPSRQDMSSAEKGRQIYYVCARGECKFWQAHVDENGNPVSFDGDPADELAKMNLRR